MTEENDSDMLNDCRNIAFYLAANDKFTNFAAK